MAKDLTDTLINATAALLPQIARTQQEVFSQLAKEAKDSGSKSRLRTLSKELMTQGLEAYKESRRMRENLAKIEGQMAESLRRYMNSATGGSSGGSKRRKSRKKRA